MAGGKGLEGHITCSSPGTPAPPQPVSGQRSHRAPGIQRSLPGDSCPFSMLVAHGWVGGGWSCGHPMRASCGPLSAAGCSTFPGWKEQHPQGAQQPTSLADRRGLGETCFFKGIFVQNNCSFGLLQSPLGGRFIVYIDSCTISQPSPPPSPAPSPAVL